MLAYIELIRPINCVMVALAVVVGALVANPAAGLSFPTGLIYAVLSAILITAAGNSINDYADVEIDKINRRDRPIPSGRVKKKTALFISAVFFAFGLALSYFVNTVVLTIAVINIFLLVAYSFFLKHKTLIGNVAISFMVGSTFLYGGAVFQNLSVPFFLAVIAMFANLARELVKKIEDEVGDRWYVIKKFISSFKCPIKFGEREMRISAAICLAIAILLSPIPYTARLLKFSYLWLVAVADAIFFLSLFRLVGGRKKIDELRGISRLIKIGMLVALSAFLAGVFI